MPRVIHLAEPLDYEAGLHMQDLAVEALLDGSGAETIYLLEHSPVYTIGRLRDQSSLRDPDALPHPVFDTNRGGQATYHGPGQLVVYTVIDFKRRKTGVRTIVSALENSIIATLAEYGISAAADPKRPGVYVDGRKIASLGLRIKNGSVYHGLALNVDMDLAPFTHINPCGYAGLEMTQIADWVQPPPALAEVAEKLTRHLRAQLTSKETT